MRTAVNGPARLLQPQPFRANGLHARLAAALMFSTAFVFPLNANAAPLMPWEGKTYQMVTSENFEEYMNAIRKTVNPISDFSNSDEIVENQLED